MKQKAIRLTGSEQANYAAQYLRQMPIDSSVEVVFRNANVSKTLAQLGTLFGLWLREIEEQTGAGWTVDRLHRHLKHKFLVNIYMADKRAGNQEQWAEHLELLLEKGEQDKIQKHIKRISLAWITKEQHSQYLRLVWNWAIDQGFNLTIPDRYRGVYRP